MRATEIIRGILDIIDNVEAAEQEKDKGVEANVTIHDPDAEINRFKQIVDLVDDKEDDCYANEPNEKVASIDAVTTLAGGGVNGPKHPADIRGEHPSLYPGQVWGDK